MAVIFLTVFLLIVLGILYIEESNGLSLLITVLGVGILITFALYEKHEKTKIVYVDKPVVETVEVEKNKIVYVKGTKHNDSIYDPMKIHYQNDYAAAPKWVFGEDGDRINVINNNRNTINTYVWYDGEWNRID